MNLKDTYNLIAKDWHKQHIDSSWWIDGLELFTQFLPEQGKVLDLGCGTGMKSKWLHKKGFNVLGSDLSDEMIQLAKEITPEARFKVLDMFELDTLEETFDGIVMHASLLHVPKARIQEVLKTVKNKLNDKGLVYIVVKERWEDQEQEETKKGNEYGYEYERFFSYFDIGEVDKVLTELGFEVVSSTSTDNGRTNWIQVIGKKL